VGAEGGRAVPDHARHLRPDVGFVNGLAFYNALRFNGKKAVLLAYPNEGTTSAEWRTRKT